LIGKTLAHYRIIDKLGEGGMGAVFRAHDSKLEREVAIKILPKEMSGDPERKLRFAREARTLASLQHANIASVYGYEEVEGLRFLVMEVVEGEDLQERLSRGAIPIEEAIDIANQMAVGLETAHDQNIVHRDLKPANVKVTPTGEVKILDFGLARAYLDDGRDDQDLSQSPTITAALTSAGVILGTAAYMSPEQARGKPVDNRGDLWAFGVILFEMLAGTRLFKGETVSDTLASVLRKEPDFDLLPRQTPPGVRRLIRRCLQRDPRMRIRSAGDASLELTDTDGIVTPASVPSGAPRWVWGLVAVLALALAASVFMRPTSAPDQATRPLHLDVALPDGLPVAPAPPTLSPDGRWLAFIVEDSLSHEIVYLRSLDRFKVEQVSEIALTTGISPGVLFWSPDSKQLGIQSDEAMFVMDVATRSVQKIVEGMVFARGASWAVDGTIIYSPTANSGLYATDVIGSTPRTVTTIDSSRADASHRWPVFLPDGKRFLFTTWSNASSEQAEIGGIYLGTFDGTPPVRILKDLSQAIIDPAGHLLFHRNGNLMQVEFDVAAGEIRGSPTIVANNVHWDPNNGIVMASVSDAGDLVVSGAEKEREYEIGWLDPEGTFTQVLTTTGALFDLFLSRDGRHACLNRLTVGSSVEIWIADLDRRTLSLLSHFGSDCWGGAFSPDGSQIAYSNQDPGFERLYEHSIDGATDPITLIDMRSVSTTPTHWSEDGQLFFEHRPQSSGIAETSVYDFSNGESRSILAGGFHQDDAVLSADGRWLAYTSNETGRSEVFVRPYPTLNRKWQISTNGGSEPHWRDDAKQLMYTSAPGRFHTVQISVTGEQLDVSAPVVAAVFNPGFGLITPDSKHVRFLCTKVEGAQESVPFRYITNWRAKLPTISR
jgi:Tol biopolymer transport system component/predicted Ser/Thr protein kinase